jgi:hypothetical protein
MSVREVDGVDIYTCDKCGTNGRSLHYKVLPDGWTQTLLSHYCPRCTAKRDAEDAEREAKSWNNTPTGKKFDKAAKKGCGCLFIAFLAALIIPHFCGYVDEAKANQKKQAEHSQTESVSEQPSTSIISSYLNGIDRINSCDELSQFYFDIAGKFHNNKMGLKGSQEQINAGNELMSVVYVFLARSAKKETDLNVDNVRTAIQNMSNVSDYRKKKALEELQLGMNKIREIN